MVELRGRRRLVIRPQVQVDRGRDGGRRVADQPGDQFERDPEREQVRHEQVPEIVNAERLDPYSDQELPEVVRDVGAVQRAAIGRREDERAVSDALLPRE
jgi:hypothetical protein